MAEKILMIDDDAMSRKMATHILQGKYDIICADSGAEGLEILRNSAIDLVLLDLYMLDMNGLEVLQQIREDASISDTKVIVLSFSGMRTDVIESIRLGVLDFIRKPFLASDLLERIQAALSIERKDRILVVDDDSINLKITERILQIPYDVTCVSSGTEALDYLQDNTPDLILLDLHMPDMSGLEVLEKLQDRNELADIPVIFLTADNDREAESKILQAGAMDYIQKPFSAQVLLRRISRILELYHYQKSLQREVEKKTEELREKNRKFVNLSTQVMTTLASAIDAKDTYTNGHSLRVANYSLELARRMGKNSQDLSEIYYAALLHDIGKIGVPDWIINKEGRLTEDEYQCMKKHPAIGAAILENISEMPSISVGAHWHHERYDGKGYPDGLKGEQIPEIARIISVADAYDAMTSNRSYRKLLAQDKVRTEIELGKGTQFDPQIADYMLEMIEEDHDYKLHG
ncbi:MAG: response regulator [Acetatifactor sp.]